MKKIGVLILIAFIITSCKNPTEKRDGYIVSGSAKGIYNGVRVYLNLSDANGLQVHQDTAIVMDGAFSFKGKVDEPKMWLLKVDNVAGSLPIIIENEAIDIVFDRDSVLNSKITGTKSNDVLMEYNVDYKKLMTKRLKLSSEMKALSITDTVGKQQLTTTMTALNDEQKNFPFVFIKKHPDNYFSLALIENLVKNNPDLYRDIEIAYDGLDSEVKNSINAQMIRRDILVLKKQNEALELLNVGGKAPDFTAPTPEGKPLSLNEIKGKVTIIDFWASWCAPCRRENPNVVNVYSKFHNNGLEIISVSLDKHGQKDKWIKAIADDKLAWHHVSNLNYFNDPVAKLYNIQSIPATFILDADGKIVAKGLRGQALEDKIAELLK